MPAESDAVDMKDLRAWHSSCISDEEKHFFASLQRAHAAVNTMMESEQSSGPQSLDLIAYTAVNLVQYAESTGLEVWLQAPIDPTGADAAYKGPAGILDAVLRINFEIASILFSYRHEPIGAEIDTSPETRRAHLRNALLHLEMMCMHFGTDLNTAVDHWLLAQYAAAAPAPAAD